MDASLILKDEVFQIVGAAMEEANESGHGLNRFPFRQQAHFTASYKNVPVGEYIPDLIAFEQVVADTRAIKKITGHERWQVLNYLRITRLPVDVILNSRHDKFESDRIVLTNHSQQFAIIK